jgi:phospholipid transport system transporter-binding protein
MPTFNFNKQNNENYVVEGELTFSSINKKALPSLIFLQSAKTICIDLKKIISADSAGLALIIEWIKQSKQYKTQLVFKNIPHQLLTLATLSGLDLNEFIADVS